MAARSLDSSSEQICPATDAPRGLLQALSEGACLRPDDSQPVKLSRADHPPDATTEVRQSPDADGLWRGPNGKPLGAYTRHGPPSLDWSSEHVWSGRQRARMPRAGRRSRRRISLHTWRDNHGQYRQHPAADPPFLASTATSVARSERTRSCRCLHGERCAPWPWASTLRCSCGADTAPPLSAPPLSPARAQSYPSTRSKSWRSPDRAAGKTAGAQKTPLQSTRRQSTSDSMVRITPLTSATGAPPNYARR
jgi:hypothetical protein